jgi:dTDP-3-amino-3,4,6-trideoxy-alpha-D-glucose transaminase
MSATHSMAATAEMAVPFVRLDRDDPELLEELLAEVRTVAENAAFTLGSYVEDFEADFAAYCEADEAVGVASGTDALAMSLRALGIGAGHEVIVPGNTFIATAEAVSIAGATPRFVDVDPTTGLITAEIVQRAITPRVKAVMPVHLYGATVDMDPLLEVARAAKIAVIEDACQAHGARYRGRRVGALGDIGCFSFYPAKNLGAWGDGGGVVTNRPELADRVRLLRSHGERPRYRHRIVGTTARLDALQAAILRVKLRHLDSWNAHRRRAAAELRRALQGTGVKAPAGPVDGGDHVYHLFVVRTDDRDLLRAHLTANGIASAVHYPVPVHRTEAYAQLGYQPGSLPIVEEMAEQVCSLPIFPGIDDDQISAIASVADLTNRMRVDTAGAPRQEESS